MCAIELAVADDARIPSCQNIVAGTNKGFRAVNQRLSN